MADAEHTFLFADLSGFTALTEVHGDEEAADLAAGFFAEIRAQLAGFRGEEVKTIGDAVMIRCDSAYDAIGLALRIVQDVGSHPGFPSVRVGLHTGAAVERNGDWFGGTVNLAARISGQAAGGEVLLSGTTAAATGAPHGGAISGVPTHEAVILHPRGRRALHNVAEPVELFEASCDVSRSREGLPIDPVCRMAVDPEHAAGSLVYRGVEYRFCSLGCAQKFAEAPERFVEPTRARE